MRDKLIEKIYIIAEQIEEVVFLDLKTLRANRALRGFKDTRVSRVFV